MLKSTPARKNYTTAGCGGCDKYELWSHMTMVMIIFDHFYGDDDEESNDSFLSAASDYT